MAESVRGRRRVLFLCTHNSARSQIAEGLLRHLSGDRFEVHSAGTEATYVRPEAVAVMAELGAGISGQESKTLERYLGEPFEYVVTVCDGANEACPTFPGAKRRLHWSFEDPSQATGNEEERLGVFRRVRDGIQTRIQEELILETTRETDLAMMRRALDAARKAAERKEVPVGAVVARGDEVLSVASVEREATRDPTAHAELLAIRRAANVLGGGWRLVGCTLYTTLEPCPMCAGAAHAAQISRLVYATPSPKSGYAGTLHNTPADSRLNHTFPITTGILEPEAAHLLRTFFGERRTTYQ